MRTATILAAAATCLALVTACSVSTGRARTPTQNVASGTDSASILVDASRDGGVWWFPQVAPFDPGAEHQGLALVGYLRSRGYRVKELGRGTAITSDLLHSNGIVIRAGEFGGYTAEETAAYREYVRAGGRLLLLADHMRYAPPDELGRSFGLDFVGITQGGNVLRFISGHPITEGLGPLGYGVGSALLSIPASALVLGTLDSTGFVDLNDNGQQDEGEPSAPVVLGAMAFGSGRIVFCGDTNLWEWDTAQPLLDNVLAWFREGS